MKFLIISKKENYDSNLINDSITDSVYAPSIISKEVIKKELGNFLVYLYPYNEIYDECEGPYYEFSDEKIQFINGLVTFDDLTFHSSVSDLFNKLEKNKSIVGDYQIFSLDKSGNGICQTSQVSVYPLFYYEDENCSALSNELKIIVDALKTFSDEKFADFYDYDYIRSLVKNGDEKKDTYRNTIFKNIKRILPHDNLRIENGEFIIEERDEIDIPEWFEKKYFEDKDALYDWYYEKLVNYADSFINHVKDQVEIIRVGITGGFDSRLTLTILSKICPKYNIRLISKTNGVSKHPDVVLGERVAECLGVEWDHQPWTTGGYSERYIPHHLSEYATTFYHSQGDFNSHDFIIDYKRNVGKKNSFLQSGNDIYKRERIDQIINYNRWSSRRRLVNSDFMLPLFSTSYELWFSALHDKHFKNQEYFKEFIFEILKRANEDLLEIPFAFHKLPQTGIKEYHGEGYESTLHTISPFLWDYQFVLDEMKPVLESEFDKKDKENDNILTKMDINCLDYVLIKDEIDDVLAQDLSFDEVSEKINAFKYDYFYPPHREFVDLNNSKYYYKTWALLKLMDFAAAASFNSFEKLYEECSFNKNRISNGQLDYKEKIYSGIGEIEKRYCELNEENKKLKREHIDLEKTLKEKEKLNSEIINSNSWKVTKPLRKVMNSFR